MSAQTVSPEAVVRMPATRMAASRLARTGDAADQGTDGIAGAEEERAWEAGGNLSFPTLLRR